MQLMQLSSARSPELTEFVSTGFGAESDSSTSLINVRRHIRARATDNSSRGYRKLSGSSCERDRELSSCERTAWLLGEI